MTAAITGHILMIVVALAAPAAWAGSGATAVPAAAGVDEEQTMTSSSVEDLRRQVTIAGQPQSVLWAAERLGPANPDSFPPGPTDTVLRAVLTYGGADEVAALVGSGPTETLKLDAPGWFPAALSPGQPLDVVRHHGVEGFMDAAVMTVPSAPGVVILERRSS